MEILGKEVLHFDSKGSERRDMEAQLLAETIERLRTTYWTGKTRSYDWRRGQLLALQRMLDENYADFEAAMRMDLHKSVFESYATEIGFLQREISHALDHLAEWMQPQPAETPVFLQPGTSQVIFEPLGVALIMGAWNYPMQLTLGPLVAAIAAGNAAVVKPPRTARAIFQTMGRIVPRYLDPEAFLVIDDDTPNDLILAQRFDKIFFTGSAEVGRIVMQAGVQHLTPVTLELGGKSPALVDATANLKVAARRIAQGKFFNAGQTCVAPDYVLAEASILEALVAELVETIREFYGADPQQSEEYARIINTKQFDTLAAYLQDGEIVCGGQTDRADRYIAPTLLKGVSPQAPVMQNEIFGPILPILPVTNMQEALAFVQKREKPLAFYLFSEDRAVVAEVLANSTSGGVCINETLNHLVVPGLPFGGVGNSGMGKYHGEWGFRDFSNARALLDRATSFDPELRYPPYGPDKLQRMKKLMNMRLPVALSKPTAWLLAHWGDQIVKLIK
jgi:aldehyde dehydrogenase (NAD+)